MDSRRGRTFWEEDAPRNGRVGTSIAGDASSNYTIRMSKRWRVFLAIAGAALICVSCAAIAYALWPLASIREQIVIWADKFRMP